MEKNAYVQTSPEPQKIQVAGFGRRLAAALIDGLILLFATHLLAITLGIFGHYLNVYSEGQSIPVLTLVTISGLILSILYYVVAWSKSGQTIAKSVLGIQVVGNDGKPLSIGKAFLRYLGYIISALPLSLGFLWIVFDKQRQGWHDKIASSYVIDGDADFYNDENLEFVSADTKPGWLWLVIWFLIVIVVPPALISSILIMGPTITRIITGLF